MAAQQTAIGHVVNTCGFTGFAQKDYIRDNEGLDRWINFTLIDCDYITIIAKSASRHTVPFTIGVLKLKCLKALKFWVDDKFRMNKTPTHGHFTRAVLQTYICLYASSILKTGDNVEFVVGPQLDVNDWNTF